MRTVSRTIQILLAIVVLVAGLSAATVRVLFPNADRYRDDLESWLAGVAGRPVVIGSLEAHWRGWSPEIHITGLELRDAPSPGGDGGGGVNASFESATVSVDLLASLLEGGLRPRHVHMGDVSLSLDRAGRMVASDASLGQQASALLEWLLAQDDLDLDATRVELTDVRIAGKPLTLTNLRLVVRNEGASHTLEAAVDVPGARDGAISTRAHVSGDPTTGGWSGDVALEAAQIDLAALDAWRGRPAAAEMAGRASLSLDSHWRAGRLARADGTLAVRGMRVTGPAGDLAPTDADARLTVVPDGDGWRLALLDPQTTLLSFRDPVPLANVFYEAASARSPAHVRAAVSDLDVALLAPLLPMAIDAPEERWRALASAHPTGHLHALELGLEPSRAGVRDFTLTGRLADGGIAATGGLPALAALEARFEAGPKRVRVHFDNGRLRAELPEYFPAPIEGRALSGEIELNDNDAERRLVLSDFGFATRDVEARATGELLWSGGDPVPFVDLTLGFNDGDLERLEYFIPTGIFGEKTGAWLDQAFPRGRLTAGTVKLRGRPPHTLSDDPSFEVTVHAAVRGATVRYLPDWPSAERVSGTVQIADRHLVSNVSEGYFFGARIRPSQWSVDDIIGEHPVFEWRTRIDGTSEDAMRYLRESPLRESFQSLIDNVEAHGSAHLALNLAIPLAGGDPRIAGTLRLSDNTVDVPSLAKGFTKVSGRIGFDQDGLRGEKVTGDYLGRKVSAMIETIKNERGHTRARLTGSADAEYLARHLHNAGLLARPDVDAMPILEHIEGEAPWQATVDVLEAHRSGVAPVVLRVESNLRSAALTLPAPFNKSAGKPLPIVVEARFADSAHREMHLTMGSLASGIFDLRDGEGGYRLHRANVHLGGGPAQLPDNGDPRLTITGRVAHTDLGAWSDLALSPQDGDALPTHVDVAVDRLAVLGADFDNVHITASSTDKGGWRASIVGDDVDGQIVVPTRTPGQPVVAKFDRLRVSPLPKSGADPTDPRSLPPLEFSCHRCTFGETNLRNVELITSKMRNGLSIDSLRLRNAAFDASASATWTVDDTGGQRTRLDARLASPDLGDLLTALGHKGGATKGGVTDVTLTAAWDGPPSDFDLQRLDGVLHFRAGEGTLTDVERGTAGRLFGLLVVPDLPRRLKGDFSDLFADGFAYRNIQGTFNIERGNAYTNDLSLDGSLARIDIAGRTGLIAEDYDQLITVTPKLSASLPLMPIWLVEKAFRKEIFNELFAYQYTVTGSWDEPSVTRVRIQHDPSSGRS